MVHDLVCSIELWIHLGIWGSTQKSRVALGYRIEQLLRFFRALPTSRVHPQLNGERQIMNHFFNVQTHKRTAEFFTLVSACVNDSTHVEICTLAPRFAKWAGGLIIRF